MIKVILARLLIDGVGMILEGTNLLKKGKPGSRNIRLSDI